MKRIWQFLYIVLLTTLIPLGLRLLFDWDLLEDFFEVMSLSFIVTVPFAIGILTIALSPKEWVKKGAYVYLMPWIPLYFFCALSILTTLESWACWVMVMPLFMPLASLGGVVGAYLKRHFTKGDRLNISIAIFIPFLAMPLENLLPAHTAQFTTTTHIDIEAPAATIWQQVLRVKEIGEAEDRGGLTQFLGLPRPVKAELDTGAIGGSRKAIFTDGLVFDEVVTAYKHEQKMSFTIEPSNIPKAMDKHVLIGGEYFDVQDGTYELEPLGNGKYRLHLYSHFEMKTNFNFYAGWWGDKIMSDIQDNILQIIKTRCEKP